MKVRRKLKKSKKFLFHLHTNFTDGKISIKTYFDYARKHNLILGFLEHIRRIPSYNPERFINEIKTCGYRNQVPYKIGFEINILKNGLNIQPDLLHKVNLIGLAVHTFNGTPLELIKAFINTIKMIRDIKPNMGIIWVHSGLWFNKKGFLNTEIIYFINLLKYAVSKNLLIEYNLKHDLPPYIFRRSIPRKQKIIGYDIHTENELRKVLK